MTTADPIELSVILPAYNEGRAVCDAVELYLAALPQCCPNFEIVVVNDASRDDTLALIQAMARDNPRVRVLDNEKNMGQPLSMLRGFAHARGEIVTHNGVDLPFDPADTGKALARMRQGPDVLVVERESRESYGAFRKLVSWCNIAVIWVLFRSPFYDHNFVQFYRRRVVDSIDVKTRGVSNPPVELIVKSIARGFRVEGMFAPYHPRRSGKSSVTLRKIVHTALELLQMRLMMWRHAEPRDASRGDAVPK